MADLKEVFEMATKQMEPDQDSWKDQERRQRRAMRNRKIGAFAAVVAILIAAGALVIAQRHPTSRPAHHPSPSSVGVGALRWLSPAIVGLDGSVQTSLSTVPVNARSLSMSPDGSRVAFVTNENGINQVGVVDLGSGAVTLFPPAPASKHITSFPTAPGAEMPAWSPDGSKIAFTNGNIFVIGVDGSGMRRLTHDAGVDLWPTWSPDGSTIAYSNSGRQALDDNGFSPTQEIWTVPAAGGVPSRITRNGVHGDMPAFSPDGSKIAFFAGGISVMNADGTHVRSLPGLPSSVFNPRWAPDGSHLVYLQYYPKKRASDGGPLLTIHVYNLKTGTTSTVRGTVDSDVDAPQWTSNGALLVNRYTG